MARKTLASIIVVAVVSLISTAANASLLIDLRFTDGSHTKAVAAGSHTVEVWAQVRGTNTSSLDDGFKFAFGSVRSDNTINGGVLSPAVGTTSGVLSAPLPGATMTLTPAAGSAGSAQNATADNIQDWGTLATNNLNTIKFSSTQNSGNDPTFSDDGPTFNQLGHGGANAGTEFLVGTFVVSIAPGDINLGAGAGAQTRFNWVKGTGSIPTTSSRGEDSAGTANATTDASYLASVAGVNSVTFEVIPEPSSIAVLGLSLVGLASRRRKAC